MKTRKRAREEEAHLTPQQELWQAVREEDTDKLRRVLRERRAELKGELDTTDPTSLNHQTALIMCAYRDFRAGVKLLLSVGGFRPLFIAAQLGIAKLVRILLSHGASVDLSEDEGATALFIAAQNNHPEVVSLLLKGGVDANLTDIDGGTPLCIAAQKGHSGVVSLLIAYEAQLDMVTVRGCNALFLAAWHDRPEVCAMLIGAGLDPATPNNNNGWSPLSHYGHYLHNNETDAWDGVDDETRPRLSDDEKRDRRALLVAARDAFLLQKKREENWQRRAPFIHALVGSGLHLTAAQKAEHAAFQAAMDFAAPIAPVPVDRLRDIFGNEGFVRTIATFV